MTDEKERRINPRSLQNLKLGAEARYQGKVRRNTTLLPETIEWLEGRGNVSEQIDQLVAAAKNSISKNTHNSKHQQTEPSATSNHTHNSIIPGGVIHWNVYKSVQSYDRKQNLDVWDEWELVGSYKSEVEADRTIQNLKEYNHRMNSGDHVPLRLRFEKRLEVIAPVTADADITVTPTVKELQVMVDQLSQHLVEAEALNAALDAEMKKWVQSAAQAQYQLDDVIAERDNAQSQLEDMAAKAGEWYEKAVACEHRLQENQQLTDLETTRDRVLGGLKLGKQAPEYKRTKASLDRFIAELRGC